MPWSGAIFTVAHNRKTNFGPYTCRLSLLKLQSCISNSNFTLLQEQPSRLEKKTAQSRGCSDGKHPFCSLAATVDSLTFLKTGVSQWKKHKCASLKKKKKHQREQIGFPLQSAHRWRTCAGTARNPQLPDKEINCIKKAEYKYLDGLNCVLSGRIQEFKYLTVEFCSEVQPGQQRDCPPEQRRRFRCIPGM